MALLEGMVLVGYGLSVISEECPSSSLRSPHSVMEPTYLLALGELGFLCANSPPHGNCSLLCVTPSPLSPGHKTWDKHPLRSVGPLWTTASSPALYPQSLAARPQLLPLSSARPLPLSGSYLLLYFREALLCLLFNTWEELHWVFFLLL